MQPARVLGKAIATTKHPSFVGTRLVVVQPLGVGDTADGDPLVVVDGLGAAVGSVVLINSDGAYARDLLADKTTPARWTIMGLIDPQSRTAL